jgi:hypothetical protein
MRGLFALFGSKRSQRGFVIPAAIGALGSLGGSLIGKHGAKQAAQSAAQSQQDLQNQAIAQQQAQAGALRNAIMAVLGGPNPFQQAAGGMHPFFSQPGQDVAMFGPGSPTGSTPTPMSGQASFFGPPPQQPGVMQPPILLGPNEPRRPMPGGGRGADTRYEM